MNRQGRQLVRCRQIVTIATIIMSTVVSGIQILLGEVNDDFYYFKWNNFNSSDGWYNNTMHWITLFRLQIICKTFLVSSSSLELPLVVHNDFHAAIFHLSSSSRNSTEEFYPSWNHRYIGKIVPVMLMTSIFVTKTRNNPLKSQFKALFIIHILCYSYWIYTLDVPFTKQSGHVGIRRYAWRRLFR